MRDAGSPDHVVRRASERPGGGGMTIVADYDKCEGLGMCQSMAHEYFELDDDDNMTILQPHPPEADRDKVRAAVESCPVMALTLQD
jgi:ferredoxin